MWQEDVESNLTSAAATVNKVGTQLGSEGDRLHAIDFLVYALLQMGDERSARSWVEAVPKS